jgi:2,3-bisphosphoglycerate-independent phosphoglycerate mutase
MSAGPITDALVAAIDGGEYDFIVANYANPDMVGHTGVWDATVRALGVARRLPRRLVRAALGTRRQPAVITADHGNIEEMRDAEGQPQTKHTTSPVPVVLVGERHRPRAARRRAGRRGADALRAARHAAGPEMTGTSLLRDAERPSAILRRSCRPPSFSPR